MGQPILKTHKLKIKSVRKKKTLLKLVKIISFYSLIYNFMRLTIYDAGLYDSNSDF